MYIVPIVKLLDLPGTIKKHLLGPRARTQEEMNMNFQGAHCNLGERYTVSCSESQVFGSVTGITLISTTPITVGYDQSALCCVLLLGVVPGRVLDWIAHPLHSVLC